MHKQHWESINWRVFVSYLRNYVLTSSNICLYPSSLGRPEECVHDIDVCWFPRCLSSDAVEAGTIVVSLAIFEKMCFGASSGSLW